MALRLISLEEFGKAFVPKRFIPILRRYLLTAGYSEVPYRFFGLLFYISAIVTGLIYLFFVIPYLQGYSPIKVFILSFAAWFVIQLFFATFFILMIYFYLDLKIYYRTRRMEEQLADYLQIVSANLKGGMTFERALWSAIKPRFTVLAAEMEKASKKVMTGYEVGKALTELSDKYDSLMLKRTVDLLISELESGGNVADLIDRIVDNLKETKALKDEMSASATAYIIFITIIVIILAPLLFSLSFHLLVIILNFIDKLGFAAQRASSLPFSFSAVNIDANDFRIFSTACIVVISLFSSLIVSIVEKGDIKGGVKYIPIYVLGSMVSYIFFMKVLSELLSGIIR